MLMWTFPLVFLIDLLCLLCCIWFHNLKPHFLREALHAPIEKLSTQFLALNSIGIVSNSFVGLGKIGWFGVVSGLCVCMCTCNTREGASETTLTQGKVMVSQCSHDGRCQWDSVHMGEGASETMSPQDLLLAHHLRCLCGDRGSAQLLAECRCRMLHVWPTWHSSRFSFLTGYFFRVSIATLQSWQRYLDMARRVN